VLTVPTSPPAECLEKSWKGEEGRTMVVAGRREGKACESCSFRVSKGLEEAEASGKPAMGYELDDNPAIRIEMSS
jgi:hypothetical protein